MPFRKIHKYCFSLLLTMIMNSSVSAASTATETHSLFDLPLTELINIEISTAGKTEERIKDIPASVVIITRKDIERYGYTTLTEILENTPGMYNIYSYFGAPGNYGVRGFWNPYSQNSNIAFLVNGVKQINDDVRSTPMAKVTVPVEAIDHIEIIKGPMSVIYGSGASFGVINVITNEAEDDDVSLVSATYGSRNTSKISLRASNNNNDMKLVINASAYKTDGLNNKFSELMGPSNLATLPSFGVTNADYSTDGLLEHQNEYLGISGAIKNFYFDTAIQNTDVDIYAVAPSLRSGNERSSDNFSLRIGHKQNIQEWISYDASLTYFDHDEGDILDFFDPNSFGTRDVNYKTWEAEFTTTLTPDPKLQFVIGLNHKIVTEHLEAFNLPPMQADPVTMTTAINQKFSRDEFKSQGIFAQATYKHSKRIVLVAGLRWENHPSYTFTILEDIGTPGENLILSNVKSNDEYLPRLAAIYHADINNTLKLLYGEASKIVNEESNVPESTKTYEINHIYMKNRNYLSTSIFRNELDDLFAQDIVVQPGGVLTYSSNRNGKIKSNGIELMSQSFITDNLIAEFNYTYQKTDDITNNTDAPYSPDVLAQAKLSYNKHSKTYSLIGRYTRSMHPISNIGDTVDSYTVTDFNYRADNVIGKGYINLRISNIFDEEIRYPTNPVFNPIASTILDRGTIGPERSVFGSLGWKF